MNTLSSIAAALWFVTIVLAPSFSVAQTAPTAAEIDTTPPSKSGEDKKSVTTEESAAKPVRHMGVETRESIRVVVEGGSTPMWVTVGGWIVTGVTLLFGLYLLRERIRQETQANLTVTERQIERETDSKLRVLGLESRARLFERAIEAIHECTAILGEVIAEVGRLSAAEQSQNRHEAAQSQIRQGAEQSVRAVQELRVRFARGGLLVPPSLDREFQDLDWKIAKCLDAYFRSDYNVGYSAKELDDSFKSWREKARIWKNENYPELRQL